MHAIKIPLSDTLWRALQTRAKAEGTSVRHAISTALANQLAIEERTLFQVSTSRALVEGIYHGEVTVGKLKRHGDFGLGTFDELDGEMIVLDGRFYRAGSDFTVAEMPDTTRTPFALVTHFEGGRTSNMAIRSFVDLTSRIDGMRESDNVFYAIRAHGRFSHLRYRCACRHPDGVRLGEATADQALGELSDVDATLVGFYTPPHATSIGIPGYHLHVLTDDRRAGGHVFDCASEELAIAFQVEVDVRIALPESPAFLKANLMLDSSAELAKAETLSPATSPTSS